MYDQPAQAEFISTYVPVNFDNLYKIGTTQASMIQQAADNFYGQLQKFGEFRSPSTVDTQRYYDLTLDSAPIQGIIQEAITNPNALKDPAFRSRMNSVLNGVDYRSLSLLRESADNLRQGLETRAKMQALGQYNAGWDDSNIPMYDTLGTGQVFSDITPIKWMSANELSDPYFNNLEPSSLGSVMKNGILYDRTGISYNTLYDIASARFNDLVATPQGQKYYRDLLRSNNGNQDAARQAFIGMIADSQRDRMRNIDTVNPAFLANLKAQNSSRKSSSGSSEYDRMVFRRDNWSRKQQEHMFNQLGSKIADGSYLSYMNKRIQDGDKQAQSELNSVRNAVINKLNIDTQLSTVEKALFANPTNRQLQKLHDDLLIEQEENNNFLTQISTSTLARQEFEDAYRSSNKNIDTTDRNYSPDKYNNAIKRALHNASIDNDIYMDKDGDRALTTADKGIFTTTVDSNGVSIGTYNYPNSTNFALPEQIFEVVTGGIGNRDPKRRVNYINPFLSPASLAASLSIKQYDDDNFGFDDAFIRGEVNSVKFIPGNEMIDYGDRAFIQGKVRVPLDEIKSKTGRGMGVLLGKQSTISMLKKHYDARIVKEKVNDDDVEMVEFDAYKILPKKGSLYDNDINIRYPGELGTSATFTNAAYEQQMPR